MNFPLENPIFLLFYWLVNTPGVGGIIAGIVGGGSLLAYGLTLYWIRAGAQVDERTTYAYPTPALHADDGQEGGPHSVEH